MNFIKKWKDNLYYRDQSALEGHVGMQVATQLGSFAITFATFALILAVVTPVLFAPGTWLSRVNGHSMDTTLKNGQILFAKSSNIKRDDIVVANMTEDMVAGTGVEACCIVKRVIGMPGDHIVINSNNEVVINGDIKNEPYLNALAQKMTYGNYNYQDVVLGEDEYFVMGDNRGNSFDSRQFGAIHSDHLISSVSETPTKVFAMKCFVCFIIILLMLVELDVTDTYLKNKACDRIEAAASSK